MTLYVSSSPIADRDQNYSAHAADACWTADGHTMQLAPANIHTQIAAGSALNTTTGFTIPTNNGNIGYSTQIILGGGGANPVNYTITGTWASNPQTDTIQAAGAGT